MKYSDEKHPLKLKAGWQKKKARKTLVMQEQIDNWGTRFYNHDIKCAKLLEGLSPSSLSLLVLSHKMFLILILMFEY
jgi:hypothetical protein